MSHRSEAFANRLLAETVRANTLSARHDPNLKRTKSYLSGWEAIYAIAKIAALAVNVTAIIVVMLYFLGN